MTTYLLAGGGTAGHVNPLLAVADALRDRDDGAEVLVLGTREGLEARLVPERGYELLFVDKVPFPRRPNVAALRFPRRFMRAVSTVRGYLRERSVHAVVGFGGYASAPAYRAAHREKVPFVVHEANARPGLANILGARSAAAVGVAFPGTPIRGAEPVGMPLRAEIARVNRQTQRGEAAAHFGLDPDRPVLLVFGGSLGAARLNAAFGSDGGWRAVRDAGWQLVHVVGGRSNLMPAEAPGYTVRAYIDRMDLAYALADVIVSRAGSATVSEVSALGIPVIYVPYAVGNGEQALNAAPAVDAGAALIVEDAELTADAVRERIVPVLQDPVRRAEMARAAQSIGERDGTANVLAMIDRVLGR